MVRPKDNDYPMYMWPDGDRGGFIVENPLTGRRKRFPREREKQARETAQLLAEYIENRRRRALLEAGRPKLNDVIERWKKEAMVLQPWDESTRQTALQRLARIQRELGTDELGEARLIEDIDCVRIGQWLDATAERADPYNKWRAILVHVWTFAVAKGLAASNEAAKVPQRSTSRKIASNRKRRRQLDAQGFIDIHAQAGELLRVAMEFSLVTTLSRHEICGLRHEDFRGGYLYVIREKTSGDSDMAFIRIRVTAEMESLRARALKLDAVASPYLIHRRPARMQRRWTAGKPHWTYVNPRYLTELFAAARDAVPRFAALPERERPTFHEIRGLAARLARQRGMAKEDIKALMTHTDKRTTEIYLERGRDGLTDENFVSVAAPFSVRELLGA
jgi:enterobacteria phage integrase